MNYGSIGKPKYRILLFSIRVSRFSSVVDPKLFFLGPDSDPIFRQFWIRILSYELKVTEAISDPILNILSFTTPTIKRHFHGILNHTLKNVRLTFF
jgi:hypothetical protein